jgi:hypothetical protein
MDRRVAEEACGVIKAVAAGSHAVLKLAALAGVIVLAGCGSSESQLRRALASQSTGTIHLPSGVIAVSSELQLAPGAHDLEIIGSGTSLQVTEGFRGRAVIVGENARHIALRNISIDGNRREIEKPLEMAPPENYFRLYYQNNGVLFDRVEGLAITDVDFHAVAGFAILVSRSSTVRIARIDVEDSGSLNPKRRNNSTGGIVIEEGSSDFEVRDCVLRRIRGNGIWTHSLRISPRLRDGLFAHNNFDTVGRDAIEVGHATHVRVEDNTGRLIGFPADVVDVENSATPVALDTAGNVDRSVYARNSFEDIDGKCIDLDGFHDGEVRENHCVSRRDPEEYPFGQFGIVINNTDPGMRPVNIAIERNIITGTKFGALFVIGSGHRILGNTFDSVNTAGCNENAVKFGCIYKNDEPKMLETGIYLGRGGARAVETHGNVIRGNTISGHHMSTRCIEAAPGVSLAANTIDGNTCMDQAVK